MTKDPHLYTVQEIIEQAVDCAKALKDYLRLVDALGVGGAWPILIGRDQDELIEHIEIAMLDRIAERMVLNQTIGEYEISCIGSRLHLAFGRFVEDSDQNDWMISLAEHIQAVKDEQAKTNT